MHILNETEEISMNNDTAHAILDSAIENGIIYNVDFVAAKDGLNHTFEIAARAVQNVFLSNRDTPTEESDSEIYYGVSSGLLNFPSKKFSKLLADSPTSVVVDAANALVAEWSPVAVKLKAAKVLITKTRKPSDKPRTTPERTIENTGTCGICGKNVKLDSMGNIVSHGFTIRYGFQEGNCYGVGFKPIEVSGESRECYLEMLKRELVSNETALENVETLYAEKDLRMMRMKLESVVRWLTADIEMFAKLVANWESKPLPIVK
jgi:hypothetical protein